MKKRFQIIFFGTPEFAVQSLNALIKNDFNVIACVTKPDRPSGRNLKVKPSPVKIVAQENNIPVLTPEKITARDFFYRLKELAPDVIIVIAFGKILPKEIIYLPTFHTLNVHASLLPKYRGASPIHYALLNGEKETGVSIIKMDENMDTGPIISQEKIKIQKDDTFGTLHDKLTRLSAKLLPKTLEDYFNYKSKLVEQKNEEATYTKILKKENGKIDWHEPAENIARKIRAFNPWPGTFAKWQGNNLKIIEGSLAEDNKETDESPGKVLIKNDKILVKTGTYPLEIKKLQLAGSIVLTAAEFISGHPDINGSQLT